MSGYNSVTEYTRVHSNHETIDKFPGLGKSLCKGVPKVIYAYKVLLTTNYRSKDYEETCYLASNRRYCFSDKEHGWTGTAFCDSKVFSNLAQWHVDNRIDFKDYGNGNTIVFFAHRRDTGCCLEKQY